MLKAHLGTRNVSTLALGVGGGDERVAEHRAGGRSGAGSGGAPLTRQRVSGSLARSV